MNSGQSRTTPQGDFLGEPAVDYEPEPGSTDPQVVERAPGTYATPSDLAPEEYAKRAELPSRRPAPGEE